MKKCACSVHALRMREVKKNSKRENRTVATRSKVKRLTHCANRASSWKHGEINSSSFFFVASLLLEVFGVSKSRCFWNQFQTNSAKTKYMNFSLRFSRQAPYQRPNVIIVPPAKYSDIQSRKKRKGVKKRRNSVSVLFARGMRAL